MIGMAYVTVRRWIGLREVLQAAPVQTRVLFWLLVVSGIGLASVTVSARGEIVQPTSWVSYWPFLAAVVTWAFLAGSVIARLNSIKDALEKRVSALEGTVVRTDKLDDKLEIVNAKLDSLHKLLERSDRDWRDLHHGGTE